MAVTREDAMMEQINVLVVDDSLVIRGMIVNILENDPQIRVVGAAASAVDADAMLRQNIVDVVTLDIEMPGQSGLDYLPTLARRRIPTVMLSGQTVEGSQQRSWALRQGASACFNKANAVREAKILIQQVKDAAHRRVRLSPEDAASLMPPPDGGEAVPQPAAEAPGDEAGDRAQGAWSVADKLIRQHGAEAGRILAERVGRLALNGELKHIESWQAIAAIVDQMVASAVQH